MNWSDIDLKPFRYLLLLFLFTGSMTCAPRHHGVRHDPSLYQSRPWSLATSGVYNAVQVGDLNGDQHPDIVKRLTGLHENWAKDVTRQ